MEDRDYGMDKIDRPKTEDLTIRDCPEDLDQYESSRTVSQIINNTFYKWKEFELDDNGEFCIVMEKPEYRHLTADEAKELLEKSGKWVDQAPDPDEREILEPTDPSVDLPTVPVPYDD